MGWITDILYDAIEIGIDAMDHIGYMSSSEKREYLSSLDVILASAREYVEKHGQSHLEKYQSIIEIKRKLTDPNYVQCENCLEVFNKSEMRRCKTCGRVLCSECRKTHKCHLIMGQPKNKKADEFAALSAEYNQIHAKIEAAYNKGYSIEHNYNDPDLISALPHYIEAARQSHFMAQYRIGMLYEEGEVIDKNPDETFFWYSEALKNGPVLAESLAPWMFTYYAIHGGAANLENTEYWYSQIPFNKSTKEVVKNLEETLELAYYQAGLDYYYGVNVEKDILKAVHYIDKCNTQFEDDLIDYELIGQIKYELAMEYELGTILDRDMDAAIHKYTESAEYGNIHSYCRLGMFLEEGDVVEQDLTKAVSMYSFAAERGQAVAQFRLGRFYYEGVAVPKNIVNAQFWIRKAVEADNEDALAFVEEHPDLSVTGVTHVSYQASGDIIQGNVGVLAKDDAIVNRATVSSSEDTSILSEIREKQDYKFCMYCGQRLPVEAMFCMACGKKL